jgi:hypothetical protein
MTMARNPFGEFGRRHDRIRSYAVRAFVALTGLVGGVAAEEGARPDDPLGQAVRRINGPRSTAYDPDIEQVCQVLEAHTSKQEPEGEVLMALSKCQVHAGRLDRAAQLCATAKKAEAKHNGKLSQRPKAGASEDDTKGQTLAEAYLEKCRTNLDGITDAVKKEVHLACASSASGAIHIERDQKELLRPKPNSAVYLYQGEYEITCNGTDGSPVRQQLQLADKFTQLTVTVADDKVADSPLVSELRIVPAHPMALESRWSQRKTAYVLGGAGVLALGVGVAIHLQVPSIVDQMSNEPDDGRYNQLRSRAMGYQTAAISLEVVGGLLGVASALCYFHVWPFADSKSTGVKRTLAVQPALTRQGAYLLGTF